MKIWKNAVLFYLGGMLYMSLELVWRGRSHGTMFLAGGTCFLLIGGVCRKLPLPLGTVTAAGLVTAVELGFGLVCNRQFQIWDYRSQTGNFLGQICPVYSLLWMPVSLAGILIYGFLEQRLPVRHTMSYPPRKENST